jgi:dienelactone hydrolase
MRTRDIDYRCDEANLRGYLAMGENAAGPRPGVLVFHEGLGLGEFAMERARRLAGLGYVALAADMFGDQRQASNLQEVATLVGGLAREGANLKAVVSFHGVLVTKMPAQPGQVKASVMVCTGVDDPLAPPDQVADFESEMRAGSVKDWQIIAYGNTLHGFTNPAADGSMMRSALYNEQADRRSWASMKSLFDEVLT